MVALGLVWVLFWALLRPWLPEMTWLHGGLAGTVRSRCWNATLKMKVKVFQVFQVIQVVHVVHTNLSLKKQILPAGSHIRLKCISRRFGCLIYKAYDIWLEGQLTREVVVSLKETESGFTRSSTRQTKVDKVSALWLKHSWNLWTDIEEILAKRSSDDEPLTSAWNACVQNVLYTWSGGTEDEVKTK